MKIYLEPFNKTWAESFEFEKKHLRALLCNGSPKIEHIGSTSLSDGIAKPIVDILIGLDELAEIERSIDILVSNEYIYYEIYNDRFPERRHFVKVDGRTNIRRISRIEDDIIDEMAFKRRFHLHVTRFGSEFWNRHVAFRNLLRVDKDIRLKYFDLKMELSKQDWPTMQQYADSKNEFIRIIENQILNIYSEK